MLNPKIETAPSISETRLQDLEPDVFRQRLLFEGHFGGAMTKDRVCNFLTQLAKSLNLRTYGDPVVFQPHSGMGSDENAGFDAFVPLIDSGISAYFWTEVSFFSVLLYTCKGFDADVAIFNARKILDADTEIVAHSF